LKIDDLNALMPDAGGANISWPRGFQSSIENRQFPASIWWILGEGAIINSAWRRRQ
jgi:hypothetical protein